MQRRSPRSPRPGPLSACLLALVALLAACGGGGGAGGGGELRPLDAQLGERLSVRGQFAGDELVYAFVTDRVHRVMMMKAPPKTFPAGVVFCFGVEDGLFLDGEPVVRPEGSPVFALLADGSAAAIELTPAELKELTRSLLMVRGPLEDEALAAKLRAAVATGAGE